MIKEPIITLLTDFGEEDPYVGSMKGVILSISPKARLVDLSHQIKRHDIRQGAFFLFSLVKYYPKGTIHLVVIDPGVGTERKAIIVQSENHFFVGPDNGVISLAAQNDGVRKVIEIENSDYYLQPVSETFHGRDIFAPVAAHLAKNKRIEEFGSVLEDWIQLRIPLATINKAEIKGEIIHIDRFGNLITNISREIFQKVHDLQRSFIEIKINNRELQVPLCSSYNEVKKGDFLGIFGSTDFLEISKNQESAADALNSQNQDKILVK